MRDIRRKKYLSAIRTIQKQKPLNRCAVPKGILPIVVIYTQCAIKNISKAISFNRNLMRILDRTKMSAEVNDGKLFFVRFLEERKSTNNKYRKKIFKGTHKFTSEVKYFD
jgi:hypothetical protein